MLTQIAVWFIFILFVAMIIDVIVNRIQHPEDNQWDEDAEEYRNE